MGRLAPAVTVERRILIIRGRKVLLDRDLAELYGVSTKRLNEQVKRNLRRFPADFMFRLSRKEMMDWKSQFATSNFGVKMGVRKPLRAFTEQGVAMLSTVLHSERAILVNIGIMRAFVRLRKILAANKDLARRLDGLERKYDARFKAVFDAIRDLIEPPEPPAAPKPVIGFRP